MTQIGEKILIKKAVEVDLDAAEEMSAEDVDKALEKKLVNMKDVSVVVQEIVAEVLTITEAAMPNGSQLTAMKNLIKHAIYDGLDTLHALTDDQA